MFQDTLKRKKERRRSFAIRLKQTQAAVFCISTTLLMQGTSLDASSVQQLVALKTDDNFISVGALTNVKLAGSIKCGAVSLCVCVTA